MTLCERHCAEWPLVVEQPADEAAEHAATLAACGRRCLHREVRALQPDATGAGEPVEDELTGATAEHSRLEVHELLLHADRVVAVDPAAGLDIDRLAGLERLLKHVAVAVDPDHALALTGQERIDEEAAAVEHVGEALDPLVVVLDV